MNVVSRFELTRVERSALWAIINNAPIAGTKSAKAAIADLAKKGLIVNTPESTPSLRPTDRGRALMQD